MANRSDFYDHIDFEAAEAREAVAELTGLLDELASDEPSRPFKTLVTSYRAQLARLTSYADAVDGF